VPRICVIPAVSTTPYSTILASDPVTIVADVIRATTTATTAIEHGNRCIPVGSVEQARAEADRLPGALLAGEQRGEAIEGFHLDNSPVAVDRLRGETVILLSSSGTPVLHAARTASTVFISCLRTATASARAAARAAEARERDVVFLAACTRGEFRDEDRLLAGWTIRSLAAEGYEPADELTRDTLAEWGEQEPAGMLGSASVAWLRQAGKDDDLEFVLSRIEDLDFAVRLDQGELVRDE
jgi:2-phosphosulfolactate phosphatase